MFGNSNYLILSLIKKLERRISYLERELKIERKEIIKPACIFSTEIISIGMTTKEKLKRLNSCTCNKCR
mgnify:CR=1 FL=1